jgi:hypothetical protein
MSFYLSDRVKELSYTIGTGNITLSGPVNGFSSFSSKYSNGDNLFYAITDGTNYEIGSGLYSSSTLARFPVKSTNSNNLVSFGEGVKEVYVTYPATHAVFNGSGFGGFNTPKQSGIAFWESPNILNYDSNLLWDSSNDRLGINKTNPQYAIDIGGSNVQSTIRSSGLILGASGLYFPPQNDGDALYAGGRQLTHYVKNQLDRYAYDNSLITQLTGSDSVFQLSGVANQYLFFKKQNAGSVFAGPPSGCSPPCSPGYPSFRTLTFEDIPDLTSTYATNTKLYLVSGYLNDSIIANAIISKQYTNVVSGILNNDIRTASGALNASILSTYTILDSKINNVSGILNSKILTVSGITDTLTASAFQISGILNTKINNVSGILNYNIVTVSGITDTLSSQITSLTTPIFQISGILNSKIDNVSGVLRNDLIVASSASGVLNTKINNVSGVLDNKINSVSGVLRNDLIVASSASGVLRANDTAISGYFQNKTQNIIQYSPDSTKFGGAFGINYTPRSDCSLAILTDKNNNNAFGLVVDSRNNITTNGNYISIGSYSIVNSVVSNNIINDGKSYGAQVVNLRNVFTDDSGSLSGLYGVDISYGHGNYEAQNPTTKLAMGLRVSLAATSGIIDEAYDIWLGNSGNNVTNHWGIYQSNTFDNYFGGNLGLGITTPTKKLDINSDSIRLRQSKTPTSATGVGNAGDICWDAGYLYICTQDNIWKRTALSTWT